MTDDGDAANEPDDEEIEPGTTSDLVLTDGKGVTLDIGFEDTDDMYILLSRQDAAVRISLTGAQVETLHRYIAFCMETDAG